MKIFEVRQIFNLFYTFVILLHEIALITYFTLSFFQLRASLTFSCPFFVGVFHRKSILSLLINEKMIANYDRGELFYLFCIAVSAVFLRRPFVGTVRKLNLGALKLL